MGYHIKAIPKGKFGEFSKIEEEFLEAKDSLDQNNPIMLMMELSDMIGAIEAFAKKHNMTLNDLLKMKETTHRAFEDGTRQAKN